MVRIKSNEKPKRATTSNEKQRKVGKRNEEKQKAKTAIGAGKTKTSNGRHKKSKWKADFIVIFSNYRQMQLLSKQTSIIGVAQTATVGSAHSENHIRFRKAFCKVGSN